MLYFSELAGKKIVDQNGQSLGTLLDIIFKLTPRATVSKLQIRQSTGRSRFVDIGSVVKFNKVIIVENDAPSVELEENELYVGKNLNDQQILDVEGSKLVRVNDVIFSDRPQMSVSAVDIGVQGMARWFRAEKFVQKFTTPQLLSWADIAPVELARGKVVLHETEFNLKKLKPEDLADHLDRLNIRNVRKIVNTLDDTYGADVIANLNINFQTALFKSFTPEHAAKIIQHVDPDEAVDILLTLDKEKRKRIIALLSPDRQELLHKLISYSKTPIGQLISTDYFTILSSLTVREVMTKVRKNTQSLIHMGYIYVVNEEDQLVGVFNLTELLTQDSATPIYKFMIQSLIVVHLSTPKEIVMNKMIKYHLAVLPVVDEKKQMLGILRWDNIFQS